VACNVVIRCSRVNSVVKIHHIFISPGHNFFGHFNQPEGKHPTTDLPVVKCRAGWGLEGDRFYGYRPDYKGQVTFFAWETYEAAKLKFAVPRLLPSAFRRNIVVEGMDLPALIGRRFVVSGVEFEGTGESAPCHWMNAVVAPGAEEWLRGEGGLRARILTDGELAQGSAKLVLLQKVA
jgi:MOSC domain-containing protein YiiM